MSTHKTIEDLLLETLDAVSRFRVGQREAVTAALDADLLLVEAKDRLPHGGWREWLERVGLKARTATTWMRLSRMGLTAEDVITAGGINRAASGVKPASEADSRSAQRRALDEAEAAVLPAKRAYYDALNLRHRALRALAAQERDAGAA